MTARYIRVHTLVFPSSNWSRQCRPRRYTTNHERKWEIDSLCYPVRLSYHYWKTTGDTTPFTEEWKQAALLIKKTFIEQQRKTGDGPYKFERTTSWATDGVPLGGYGYPVKPVGLICSMFRPPLELRI